MREITITENQMQQRLDKFLLKYLNQAPKSFVFKMIRKKNIKVNGLKTTPEYLLQNGDIVTLYLSDDTIDNFKNASEDIKIAKSVDIIYEDDNILLVNKPAGVLSQSNDKDTKDDMVSRISYYLSKSDNFKENQDLGFRPSISNRLDINTSGIIISGKSQSAVATINDAILNKNIDKFYLVLVKGNVTGSKVLYGYHTKDINNNEATITEHKPKNQNAKEVITKYQSVKTNGEYSLLRVTLITGKSHQIRAHLKSVGLYVVGDRKYGDEETNIYFKRKFGISNQLLHAEKVKFKTIENELSYLTDKEFTAPTPQKFANVIKNLF